MEIKLKKNYRAFGKVNKDGESLEIRDKKTLEFLKENGYIETKKKKKKKSDEDITEIIDLIN
tara:strand:+ start:56 stop:241 length:186 start_codon:yes stop_codon:yes gene_type:complete